MTRVVRPASIVAAFAILFLFATVPAAYADTSARMAVGLLNQLGYISG